MADLNKLKDSIAQGIHFPGETREWVLCLKEENVPKLRKLFKKERHNLISKYKRLYLESDDKLRLCLHFMRTRYPYFTPEERRVSKNYIDLQQKISDGWDITDLKRH